MSTTLQKNIKDLGASTDVTGYLVGCVGNLAKRFSMALFSPLGRLSGIVALTGASTTLAAGHEGCLVTLSHGTAMNFTVNQDSSLTWPIGGRVRIMRIGAGQVTVVAGSGATVHFCAAYDNLRNQYGVGELIKIAANTWVFTGDTYSS